MSFKSHISKVGDIHPGGIHMMVFWEWEENIRISICIYFYLKIIKKINFIFNIGISNIICIINKYNPMRVNAPMFYKLKYSSCTILYVTGVQYSDSQFLKVIFYL